MWYVWSFGNHIECDFHQYQEESRLADRSNVSSLSHDFDRSLWLKRNMICACWENAFKLMPCQNIDFYIFNIFLWSVKYLQPLLFKQTAQEERVILD